MSVTEVGTRYLKPLKVSKAQRWLEATCTSEMQLIEVKDIVSAFAFDMEVTWSGATIL